MNEKRRYKISDFRFGQSTLTLREKTGLTQIEVADALGVSRRAIQHWEGGTAFPAGANLKRLIALYLRHGVFAPGHEHEQAAALWTQAEESAARRKSLFDESWFESLLAPDPTPAHPHRADWGDAPDVAEVYGRDVELVTLTQWAIEDQCRVIGLLGIGGIGKTTLAIRFAQTAQAQFTRVVWRSLRNSPNLQDLLTDCLRALADEDGSVSASQPENVEHGIALLMQALRRQRCLLILDNLETLLEPGNVAGCYRAGYETYGLLFQRAAETAHQSCLIFTSREMLCDLEPLQGTHAVVRGLKLPGLATAASQELLNDKELFGTPNAWDAFALHYSGNPLALKIASATVRDVFGGDLAAYLREAPVTLHTLNQLLTDQFERLSQLERDVLIWLAIEREWLPLDMLRSDLTSTLPNDDLLTALMSLRRRSLVERGEHAAIFTLQPVVMEFVTHWLVSHMAAEIAHGDLGLMTRYALMKSDSADYIRDSQTRMVLQPVLGKVLDGVGGQARLATHLKQLAQQLRALPRADQGYAGGNIVNLLIEMQGHIRGWDFSHLVLRQAYLQEAEAQDAHLEGSDLSSARFMEPLETISAMTLSADGQFLAVSSFSGQIRLWQVSDGKLLWAVQGHSRVTWALAFNADGTLLASGDHQGQVRLWDVSNGRHCQTLQGQRTWISAIAISPNGRTLVCAGDNSLAFVWDIAAERCLHTLSGHHGRVMSAAFGLQGNLFITGGSDGCVRVWDAATGDCLRTLHHGAGPIKVAFHAGGTCVASCGEEDGLIKLWDVHTGDLQTTLQRHKTGPASIAFNPEGTLLASGNHVGAVDLWDVRQDAQAAQHLGSIQAHRTFVSAVSFAPHGLLASASYGGHVRFWESHSGKLLKTFQGYSCLITVMAFGPDGRVLIQGDKSGQVRLWELHSGRCLVTLQAHAGPVWALAFSPDGKTFASGGEDDEVKLWHTHTGQPMKTFSGHSSVVWTLAFSPDGAWLASGGGDKDIRLWQTAPTNHDTLPTVLSGSTDWVWSLAFSPDRRDLASGHSNGETRVWALSSKQCRQVLLNQIATIGALQFSDDGRTLISSSDREILAWWDVESGACRSIAEPVMTNATNWNNAVALSQDGALLAIACSDQSVQLWRVMQAGVAQQIARLTGNGGNVWAVALSPDHSMVASSDDAGTIIVWDTHTQAVLHRLSVDRPYERMNINGIHGINEAQREALRMLGAVD